MPYNVLAEFGATALMIVFGVGVHCDTVLKGTKYHGSGHMFAITTWSFGISVALFIFGGAVCMNPAMVLAQCMIGLVPWSNFVPYVVADMLGAFAGAAAPSVLRLRGGTCRDAVAQAQQRASPSSRRRWPPTSPARLSSRPPLSRAPPL